MNPIPFLIALAKAFAKDVAVNTVKKTAMKTAVRTVEKTVLNKTVKSNIYKAGNFLKTANRVRARVLTLSKHGAVDSIKEEAVNLALDKESGKKIKSALTKIPGVKKAVEANEFGQATKSTIKSVDKTIKGLNSLEKIQDKASKYVKKTAKSMFDETDMGKTINKDISDLKDKFNKSMDKGTTEASDYITNALYKKYGKTIVDTYFSEERRAADFEEFTRYDKGNNVTRDDLKSAKIKVTEDAKTNRGFYIDKDGVRVYDERPLEDIAIEKKMKAIDNNKKLDAYDNENDPSVFNDFTSYNTQKAVSGKNDDDVEIDSTQYFDWLVDMVKQHSGLDESYIVFNRFVSDLDDLERRSNNILWKYIYDNISSNFVFEYVSDQSISDPEQKQITGFEDYYDKIVALRDSYVTDGGK